MSKGSAFAAAAAAAIGVTGAALAMPGLATAHPAANAKSTTLAGYRYNSYVAVPATVSATIVVPKLTCKTGPELDVWPGVGMQYTQSWAGLDIFCKSGKAHAYPLLEQNGNTKQFSSDTAHAGDKIALKLTQTTSSTTVSVTDQTHAFTATWSGAGSGTGSGPVVGDSPVYLSGAPLGVPNFGTLSFSKVLASGSSSTPGPFGSLGSSSTPLTAYDLWTNPSPSGTLQIKTGPLASSKEAFQTVFKHS